jgi:hypothetical protein
MTVRLMGEPTPHSTADEVGKYLSRFSSEQRAEAFLHLHVKAFARKQRSREAHAAFWRWLAPEWSGFHQIPYWLYIPAFGRRRAGWSADCMAADDRRLYDRLPATVTIYRGQDIDGFVGLSWTLDWAVAESFARRDPQNPNPVILEATISKADVAFAVTDREEAELVTFAPVPLD